MYHLLHRIRFFGAGLTLLMLLLFSQTARAAAPSLQQEQASVQLVVTMSDDHSYTVRVLALKNGNKLLVDLESMARALRLSFHRTGNLLVLEESLRTPGTLCTVTPGNCFVRLVSAGTEPPSRALQLQSRPVLRQSKFYLPVNQACRLFALWLERDVDYNSSSGKIHASLKAKLVEKPPAASGLVSNGKQSATTAGDKHPDPDKTVITGIEVDKRANGAIIRFLASGPAVHASLLKPDADGYAFFSLEKATCDINAVSKVFESGIVRAITPQQFSGAGIQFTVSLDKRSGVINSVEYQRDKKRNRYVLYVRTNADVEAIHKKEKEQQIAQVLNRDIEKWKLDTIVLDAGHGGKDPGAIGTQGTREKDVVMNIVHDLGSFIEQKWPDVRVIYTRKNDTFIPLYERGKIANRNGGKLFVSVHCNASPNHGARGPEVYVLGVHKNKAALDVAMFENSVIRKEADYKLAYQGFTEEHLIMSSMAQNAFARQSTILAQDILQPGSGQLTNGRGVRQAGFMVLWTPSMPSALVEIGYLSNSSEEKILQDRQEQAKIAYSIFQGLQAYRKNYETSTMATLNQ